MTAYQALTRVVKEMLGGSSKGLALPLPTPYLLLYHMSVSLSTYSIYCRKITMSYSFFATFCLRYEQADPHMWITLG